MASTGHTDPESGKRRLQTMIDRLKNRNNWHIQVFTNLGLVSGIKDLIQKSPVPLVFDHFGGARGDMGPNQPGFSDLVELVRAGRAYVKVSGAYRMTGRPSDYSDMIPLAKALITANPDRILWGSDWPHPNPNIPSGRKVTDVTPLLQVDDGKLLNQLAIWTPDPATREKILVHNPARLYGF
jgi:predicted TIM-barrel fold metal-dependent hydrolase